jgi:hypothetical protein
VANQTYPQGFAVALCRQAEAWQGEFNDMEERREVLDELTEHAYGLLDALGISWTAIPGTNRMKFWRNRKVIYGPAADKRAKPQ